MMTTCYKLLQDSDVCNLGCLRHLPDLFMITEDSGLSRTLRAATRSAGADP